MVDEAMRAVDAFQAEITRFRELVNEPRIHHELFQKRRDFNLLCSAMDIADDAMFALRSYAQHDHSDQGLAYLEILGVLQALVVQQDAVAELFEVVTGTKVDIGKRNADLAEVRDTRVRVAGHPVGGRGASHFLIRYSVSKWGCELWTFKGEEEHTRKIVNLLSLLKKNATSLTIAMRELIGFVEARSRKHKEEFVGETLSELFKVSGYFAGKIYEGISREKPMGSVGVASVRGILQRFRAALEKRSDHFKEAGFVEHDIPLLEYALDKLGKFFSGDSTQTDKDAYIVAEFVGTELEKLAGIAAEIDEDYKIEPAQH